MCSTAKVFGCKQAKSEELLQSDSLFLCTPRAPEMSYTSALSAGEAETHMSSTSRVGESRSSHLMAEL